MGFKNIYLTLDNMPPNGYTPGSTINGRIITSTYKSIHIRSLVIKVYGEANVRFTDTVTRTRTGVRRIRSSNDGSPHTDFVQETRTDLEVFTGYDRYMSTCYTVLGDTLIHPGEQEFVFSIILPTVLPSSFAGTHGSIRYWIKVKMDKAWNFDQVATAEFKVFAPKDLNYIDFIKSSGGSPPHKIDVPYVCNETKHFNFLCCRTGPLSLTVEFAKSGIVPGETLNLTIEVDNATNVNISSVKITLLQEVTWMASSPRLNSKRSTDSLLIVHCNGAEQRSNRAWNQSVIIPDVPCINIDACSIIKLQHFIMVEAIPEGMHMNLTLKSPVVIGTVPVGRRSQPIRMYDPPNIGFVQPPTNPGYAGPPPPGFIQPQNPAFQPSAPGEYSSFVQPEPPPPYPTKPDTYLPPPQLSKK